MRLTTFAWHLLATLLASRRDAGGARFRADLGEWFQGLDSAGEEERQRATWDARPSPDARLAELRGRSP